MPHCPFCHAWVERADARRCDACGRTLIVAIAITADEVGRRVRRKTRIIDRLLFFASAQIATVALFNVAASGPLTNLAAQVCAFASCVVMWRYLRSRYRSALVFALPQILLWGLRIHPFMSAFMIPLTLCIGLVLALYCDQLRESHTT